MIFEHSSIRLAFRLLIGMVILLMPEQAPAVQAYQLPDGVAKYVIILIADGWGENHINATNAYNGALPPYQSWSKYWMSTFQTGGGYDPALAWTDFDYVAGGTTDSAAAATAMFSGMKTQNGSISVDENGLRLSTISEWARQQAKASGVVTSVPISHATPGAWMSHNESRANGYAIADEGLWGDPNTTGTDIDHAKYEGGMGLTLPPQDVVIGGGHPQWNLSYVNEAMRTRLLDDSANDPAAAFSFLERILGSPDGGARLLTEAAIPTRTRLVGLFGGSGGNIEYAFYDGSGEDPENPTLADMTEAALRVLSRNPNGFVLLVEGGAVDWAAHSNRMDRMIGEMKGFNDSVGAVVDWVEADNESSWQNTLVIVTGDHETGYLTADFGVFPGVALPNPITELMIQAEKMVSGTSRRASWEDGDGNDLIDEGESVNWAWNTGGHTNSLIPLYANGIGSDSFTDYTIGDDPVRGAYVDNISVHAVAESVMPVLAPVPPQLQISIVAESDIALNWQDHPANCLYEIYRSLLPFQVLTELEPISTITSPNDGHFEFIGDAAVGHLSSFYRLMAIDCDQTTSAASNETGVISFSLQ